MDLVNEYWMQRIDAHLERGNELFEENKRAFERFVEADERNKEAFERNTEAFERNMAALARWEARSDEYHAFIREMTRRIERGTQAMVLESRQHRDEMVAEMRAQRRALLEILDRLSPPGDAS